MATGNVDRVDLMGDVRAGDVVRCTTQTGHDYQLTRGVGLTVFLTGYGIVGQRRLLISSIGDNRHMRVGQSALLFTEEGQPFAISALARIHVYSPR